MISPGAPLSSGEDARGFVGTTGPVVKDSGGNLLILTSRELMERSTAVFAEVAGIRTRVGERRDDFHPRGERESAGVRLAAWFHPDTDVQILEPPYRQHRQPIAEEHDLLLEEVCVFGAEPTGYVSRVNWFARFALEETSEPSTLTGLLRVASSDATTPFVAPGLSGALIVTKAGLLVGIVVGAIDGDAVVVPIARIFESEDLTLACAADIAKHNAAAAVLRRSPPAIAEGRSFDLLPVVTHVSEIDVRKVVEHWALRDPAFGAFRYADFDLLIAHAGATGETLGLDTAVYGYVVARFMAAPTQEERLIIAGGVSNYIIGQDRGAPSDDDTSWSRGRPQSGHRLVVRKKHANAV